MGCVYVCVCVSVCVSARIGGMCARVASFRVCACVSVFLIRFGDESLNTHLETRFSHVSTPFSSGNIFGSCDSGRGICRFRDTRGRLTAAEPGKPRRTSRSMSGVKLYVCKQVRASCIPRHGTNLSKERLGLCTQAILLACTERPDGIERVPRRGPALCARVSV